MAKKVSFEGNPPLVWQTSRDADGVWVAVCDALNLGVAGETPEELREAAAEAADNVFVDRFWEGDLALLLLDLGWDKGDPIPANTTRVAPTFAIPIELVTAP